MFIAALYVMTENWKESKHPLTDEWINCNIFVNGLLRSDKKEWTIDTHNNTDESQNDYV